LLRADRLVLLKNRRSVIIGILMPLYILFITNRHSGKTALGSPGFIVVLAVTLGLLSTSIMGYTLTVARDRERGVFQRLRVTPAPTWAIMASRLLIQVLANFVITIVVLVVAAECITSPLV